MPVATFSVKAQGYPTPIEIQWQLSDGSGVFTDIVDDGVYSGAKTQQLNVTVTGTAQDGNQFRAVASNSQLTKISEAATLHIVQN